MMLINIVIIRLLYIDFRWLFRKILLFLKEEVERLICLISFMEITEQS